MGMYENAELGSTHSVFFLASTEVHSHTTAMTGTPANKITSEAVLALNQTVQMEGHKTLWVDQGFGFADRQFAWQAYKPGALSPIGPPEARREESGPVPSNPFREGSSFSQCA